MSKIVYPEIVGLNGTVGKSLNTIKQELDKAVAACSFSVPSGFAYAGYVNKLPSLIGEYSLRTANIHNSLIKVDSIYSSSFEAMSSITEDLDLDIIVERERLVK